MNMHTRQPEVCAPVIEVDGKPYMRDAKGALIPKETIKIMDVIIDEQVRKMLAYASDLAAQIVRFKGHTLDDINQMVALLDQNYGVKSGGRKGNMTFTTFDGLMKVQVQQADNISFGPELHAAKSLIDECLLEWGAQSSAELRSIINRAFEVDKEGLISPAKLYMLMRAEIEDTRWLRAMQAIRDSIRVIGSKMYIRFYTRDSADGQWQPVPIDMAQA